MRIKVPAMLFAALAVFPPIASAQAPKLFIPVTGSEEIAVRTKNEYFLKKQLYFAKRHRIVRVNTDLLVADEKASEKIEVNFFDDLSPTYAVTRLTMHPEKLTFHWYGQNVNPSIPVSRFRDSGLTEEQATRSHAELFELAISSVRYEHDELRGRFWPSAQVDQINIARTVKKKRNPNTETYYAIRADILLPSTGSHFQIRSLESDKRYHLIIEEDETKQFARSESGPQNQIKWPDEAMKNQNDAKLRAYHEFLQSLGEDPRKADYRKDWSEFIESLDEEPTQADSQREDSQ